MKIPSAFLHPLFFKENDTILLSFKANDIITVPFKYDIAYASGTAPEQLPWEQNDETVPVLLMAWKVEEKEISLLHENRNQSSARIKIIPAIAWFIQLLFWINKKPVSGLENWKVEVQALKWKPINVEERLDFVIKKPELYHAFIQLQQLYTEIQKLYYKSKINKKK